MWGNPRETADLVTFAEEIPNGKLQFLCSVNTSKWFKSFLQVSLKFYWWLHKLIKSEKIFKKKFSNVPLQNNEETWMAIDFDTLLLFQDCQRVIFWRIALLFFQKPMFFKEKLLNFWKLVKKFKNWINMPIIEDFSKTVKSLVLLV